MALNFPDSPTLNQEVELGGKTYRWDGVKWRMVYVVTPTAQSLAPTITEVSVTDSSITFTITNNDTDSAVILYEVGDNTPDENSIELAASATSSNITISGLNGDTQYTVSATASVTGKVLSNVAQQNITTAVPITYTVATSGSQAGAVSLTFVSGAQWRIDDGTEQVFGSYHRTNKVNVPAGCDITLNNINYTHDMVMYDSSGAFVGAFTRTRTAVGFNSFPFNYPMTQTMRLPGNVTTIAFAAANINYSDANTSISAISYSTFQQLTASYAIEPADVVEYDSGGKRYRSHTFTQNGTFVVSQVGTDPTVDYLIIAGGGGTDYGSGGGGAGGYRTTNGTSGGNSTAETKVTVTTQSYPVVVGAGGSGAISVNINYESNASPGSSSSALGISTVGGGIAGHDVPPGDGGIGGSGGGGGTSGSGTRSGGAGTVGQGFAGGSGSFNYGGGGGGAGELGQSSGGSVNGKGGDGLANTLRTGSAEIRGGGGGASGRSTGSNGGAGGAGGGGKGSDTSSTNNATSGAINTGGGGGGIRGFNNGNNDGGKNGGSGIVIIRYEIAPSV